MTRPVCPYPQVAVYDGSGDPNQEASFRLRDAVGEGASIIHSADGTCQ